MGEYLLPFKGRKLTGPFKTNLLWRDGPFYIMDNHRAALWCWLQHFKPGAHYNLYHVDAHYDTMGFEEPWQAAMPKDIGALSIEDYLRVPMPGKKGEQLFRYDNYLSIFLKQFPGVFEKTFFATHNIGDRPAIPGHYDVAFTFTHVSWFYALKDDAHWVVNLDLDFFFYMRDKKTLAPLFSERYIDDFLAVLASAWKRKRIEVLTLCLTPEYCGGWKNIEPLTHKICDAVGVKFRIPK
ncbi:MAG: hypothetical protein HY291_20800 [Planctomycetes bacterium]|nr:hypothetical protein [Planctomycetota bacterium]